MPRKPSFLICALTLTALTSPAFADLTLVSLDRTLSVLADTPDSNAFTFETSFNTPSAINETLDGFGFIGSNFLAGSTTQRSEFFDVLTPGPPNATAFMQGSAALVGNITNTDPLSAKATSSATYTFSTDTTAEVRLIWSLEAHGLKYPSPVLGVGPAMLTFYKITGGFVTSFFQQAADVGEINTGFTVLTLSPGTYILRAGAYASLFQGDLLSGGTATLPADATQSAGYTVTMSIIPAPAAAFPLAIAVGGLAARRRRA